MRRRLTTSEVALAQEVFGNSIDYTLIWIYDRGILPFHRQGGLSYRGNIYFPGCYWHDFSAASLLEQRLFIHEMTHVWQHQNHVLPLAWSAIKLCFKYRFDYALTYKFHLKGGADLCRL